MPCDATSAWDPTAMSAGPTCPVVGPMWHHFSPIPHFRKKNILILIYCVSSFYLIMIPYIYILSDLWYSESVLIAIGCKCLNIKSSKYYSVYKTHLVFRFFSVRRSLILAIGRKIFGFPVCIGCNVHFAIYLIFRVNYKWFLVSIFRLKPCVQYMVQHFNWE